MNQDLSREYGTHRLVGGEGNAYVTFLTTQLKPYLDQNFPTKIDDYGIVGSSMGALISILRFFKSILRSLKNVLFYQQHFGFMKKNL